MIQSVKLVRIVSMTVIAALVLFGTLLAVLYFRQKNLVFFPNVTDKSKPLSFPARYTENFLEFAGGDVHYLIFSPANAAPGVILYFHGNAGSLEDWGYVAAEITEATGFEVWIMDYPGFGKSGGGLPSTQAPLISMGEKFIHEIQKQRPGAPILLQARSIGTGIASRLGESENIAGLILETPYLSLKELAREIYPWIPGFLLAFRFDNTKLKDIQKNFPVLIVHGTNDEIIPYRHGKELHEALGPRSTFASIQGARHNNLSDFPEYWRALKEFTAKAVPR